MKRFLLIAAMVGISAAPASAQVLTYSGDFQDSGWWTPNVSGPRDYPQMTFTVGGGGWDVEAFFIDYFVLSSNGLTDNAPEVQIDHLNPGTTIVYGTVLTSSEVFQGVTVTDPDGNDWDLYRLTVPVHDTYWDYWFTDETGYLPAGDHRMHVSPLSTARFPVLHATSGGAGAVNWINGRSRWNNSNDPYDLPDLEFVFGVIGTQRPLNPGSTVPEPATLTLLATGMAAIAARRRKQ